MLVGDALVLGEVIRSELDFNSLNDKNELLADDGECEEVIIETVSVVGDVFDWMEGVSLDEALELASNSSSNFHFLFHLELLANDLKFEMSMFA